MAKKDGSTVSAPSIVASLLFAASIGIPNAVFGINITIPVFSDILFSILYSFCVILLFIPLLRRHRQRGFNWKTFFAYVVPGFLIIFLGFAIDPIIIIPSQGPVFESLTLIRLIAAVLFGAGVVRAVVTGSKEVTSN